jgi:hypothetical protein
MTGEQVIRVLLGLAEGESILVGTDEWTAFEGFFEKAADYGEGESYLVYFDCLDDELHDDTEYEVVR